MFGTTLTAGEIRSAVVRLKQDGYALAADRLFSASSTLPKDGRARRSTLLSCSMMISAASFYAVLIAVQVLFGTPPPSERGAHHRQKLCCFWPKTDKSHRRGATTASSCCAAPADITSRMQRTCLGKQIPASSLTTGTCFRHRQQLPVSDCECPATKRHRKRLSRIALDLTLANCRLPVFCSDPASKPGRAASPKSSCLAFYTCCKSRNLSCPCSFWHLGQRICPRSYRSTGQKRTHCPACRTQSGQMVKKTVESSLGNRRCVEGMGFPMTVCRCLSAPEVKPFVFRTPFIYMKEKNYPALA